MLLLWLHVPEGFRDALPWKLGNVCRKYAGFSGAVLTDLAKLRELCIELRAKLTASINAAAAAKQATADKNSCRQATEAMVRGEIRRIKARSDYNETLGLHLWIEGTEYSSDLSHSSPDLSGTDQGGGSVSLSFSKAGSDGINIYSRRDADSDWSLLNRATISPFTDKRAPQQAGKPELRRYRAIFVVKDQETGQFSNELVITCAP